MALCYHDKQDLKSDLNIEVAREGDILKEDQDLKDIKCDKNPGHEGFIPFKDLTLEHLPIEDRNRETLDYIKKKGNIVVRLVVDKIVNGRWIKKAGSGSGYVSKYNNEYCVQTNNHVVGTHDEVKRCTVEFHYDEDSRTSVFTSRGVELGWTCPYRDITKFKFHPVPDFLHQLDWMVDRSSFIVMVINNQIVKMKTIYKKSIFFSELYLNSPLIQFMFISWPKGSISYLKSSYFKFQPVPPNILELTSMELHIDDDNGNSRVIPGDVVKFGDEFVVKISESIFQDEVKKCRLVCNGKVIGRGTRLYFQQVKSGDILRELYSGIDLEEKMEHGLDCLWIFDCHPIPSYVEDLIDVKRLYNMCCIGHPHGGIKMVTFGRMMGPSIDRFDTQYRRIAKPAPDCQCKEVNCMRYSCKTCPGSSGSPVFHLYAHAGRSSTKTYSHFLGKRVVGMYNGELIENINTAWAIFSPERFERELI